MCAENGRSTRIERCGGELLLAAIRVAVELDPPVEPGNDEVGVAPRGPNVVGDRRRVGGSRAGPCGARGEAVGVDVRVAEEGDP